VTDQLVLHLGYDIENVSGRGFSGEIVTDRYGRKIPRHAHGTANLGRYCSSTKLALEKILELYDRVVDKDLLSRRLSVTATHLLTEEEAKTACPGEQLMLFEDPEELTAAEEKERKMQKAMLSIKDRFGPNAILKGTNFREGATARERNETIGGHKA